MKDIFEIIKHERHDLQVIKFDDSIKLGCKTCGFTIFDSKDCNVDDLVKVYEFAKDKEYDGIAKVIKLFVLEMVKYPHTSIERVVRNIKSDYMQYGRFENKINVTDVLKVLNISKRRNFNIHDDTITNDYQLKKFDIDLINKYGSKIIETIANVFGEDHIVLNNNLPLKEYVVANKIYNSNADKIVILLNKYRIEELEAEFPTVTDVYKFKDMDDYNSIAPCYDDEDSENEKFIEFKYRVEKGLYDFENVDLIQLIKEGYSFFNDYEYTDHTMLPMKAALEKLLNIKL